MKQDRWESYLEWAVDSFRLSTAVAQPHTQIVTHLCYSDFQDILKVSTLMACISVCTFCEVVMWFLGLECLDAVPALASLLAVCCTVLLMVLISCLIIWHVVGAVYCSAI